MTKEEYIAEKQRQITEITNQQKDLIKKSKRIAKLPCAKSQLVALNRANKLGSLAMQIRILEHQKRLIIQAPIPKDPYIKYKIGVWRNSFPQQSNSC